jgi:hypothetical protein
MIILLTPNIPDIKKEMSRGSQCIIFQCIICSSSAKLRPFCFPPDLFQFKPHVSYRKASICRNLPIATKPSPPARKTGQATVGACPATVIISSSQTTILNCDIENPILRYSHLPHGEFLENLCIVITAPFNCEPGRIRRQGNMCTFYL